MNWFYNLKIARKLALGFGLCLLFAVLVGTVAIVRMTQMNALCQHITNSSTARIITLSKFNTSVRQFRLHEFQHCIAQDKPTMQREEGKMQVEQDNADASLAAYEKLCSATQPEDRQNLDALQADWKHYLEVHQTFLPISRRDDNKHSQAMLVGPLQESFQPLTDQVVVMLDWNVSRGQEQSQEAAASFVSARLIIIGLLALAVLLGALTSVVITRYMTKTLAQVSERMETLNTICIANLHQAVEAMEQGNLTAKIATGTDALDIHAKDEFGQMAATFNAMLERVKATITSFRASQALSLIHI